MRITIMTEGTSRQRTYRIGQQIEAQVRGYVDRSTAGAYELIEDGKPVSSDRDGRAYIPLCNGIGEDGKRYSLYVSGGDYKITAFYDPLPDQ